MDEQFLRTAYLIGNDAVGRLQKSRVILFGVGGVGSYCAEALVRAGVGNLTLVDPDTVSVTNLNRQLVALRSTVGRQKVDVMRERALDICPTANVTALPLFYLPENADSLDLCEYDLVIDAIDTVAAKIELAVRADAAGVPILSSMGTGNKQFPERFEVTDIAKTEMCPLARTMRRELRARGVSHLRVVYSREEPMARHADYADAREDGKLTPGTFSFVPGAAGLLLASEAIKLLLR